MTDPPAPGPEPVIKPAEGLAQTPRLSRYSLKKGIVKSDLALADSKQAIGAVGELLKNRLTLATNANTVDIGRPEEVSANNCPKLNIFLYQIDFDGQLRNYPLDEGQRAPLWIVLRYLCDRL